MKGVDQMPKIIPNLRSNIITKGREILFTEGYDALSMRRMAAECGIAVGTIYNYMRNKDDLVAHICMEDWMKAGDELNEGLKGIESFPEGVEYIYRGVRDFTAEYQRYWNQYSESGGSLDIVKRIHPHLRSKLSRMMNGLLHCESEEKKSAISNVMAELIIAAVTHPDLGEEKFSAFLKCVDVS